MLDFFSFSVNFRSPYLCVLGGSTHFSKLIVSLVVSRFIDHDSISPRVFFIHFFSPFFLSLPSHHPDDDGQCDDDGSMRKKNSSKRAARTLEKNPVQAEEEEKKFLIKFNYHSGNKFWEFFFWKQWRHNEYFDRNIIEAHPVNGKNQVGWNWRTIECRKYEEKKSFYDFEMWIFDLYGDFLMPSEVNYIFFQSNVDIHHTN